MIGGAHIVVFTQDADADRAFFRDVLRFPMVDAGGGWLIFALPATEAAFHPAQGNDTHELYLMCADLPAVMRELEAQGVHCPNPARQDWGMTTAIPLPGGGRIGLYQPTHPTAVTLPPSASAAS